MPNIKEIKDDKLKDVLEEVSFTEPVFLSENGKVKYVLLDAEDYRKLIASLNIVNALG